MKKKRKLTTDQVIEFLNDHYGLHGASLIGKTAIYKAVSHGKLVNYGRKNFGLFDPDEVLAVWGNKKSA